MNLRRLIAGLAVAALVLGVPSLSGASPITIDPGTGTTTTFTVTSLTSGAGPFVINGFSVTGQTNVSFGDVPYGLAGNGTWNVFSFVSTNDGLGSFTINLGGLFGLAGGFTNYAPAVPGGSHATITALAANGITVLETFDLETSGAISTPGGLNLGAFRGFSRPTADIGFLRFGGDFILIHTLEVGAPAASAVPEPASMTLLATGLAGLVVRGWRRRKSA